jgi:hypothetical protein
MFTELDKLLVDLERLDIKLWAEGDKLRFAAPNGLTPALREQLQARKPELINLLNQAGIHSATDKVNLGDSYTFAPSFAQRHFGMLQKLNPTDCFYNVLAGFKLNGRLDIAILRQSFNAIIARHDFLRTTLQEIQGELMQVVVPSGEIAMKVVDLQHLAGEQQQAAIHQELEYEWHTPFNLATECSLRVRLLCLSKQQFILLLCTHNVLFEGGALRALLHELGTYYADRLSNSPSSLPPLPMQYADCVRWQQAALMTGMEARLNYWRNLFKAGEPPFPTLAKHNAPPTAFEGDTLWIDVPTELTQQLKSFCQQTGVTLFSALLTAYTIVLHQYSGYSDITVGTTFANRNHWKLEPLIGSMLVLVSLRFDLSNNPDYLSLVKQAHQTVVDALTYQDVPFTAVAPLLHGQQRITPLFRTVFTFFTETPYDQLKLPNIEVTYLDDIHSNVMRPDLYPGIWEKQTAEGSVLRGYWQYKKAIFSRETAQSMLDSFQAILKTMVDNPQNTI